MLNGLDLFSGYGGITLALREWVRPMAYCEIDRYARGILLSRMYEGQLPVRPVWDDVRTFNGSEFRGLVDIIYGGFPCQDLSTAGHGAGVGGKRSGLFREVVRLAAEIEPAFLFLENVPAIRTRGLAVVIEELSSLGYDARWTMYSAAEVGAPHKRERWFCLAYSQVKRRRAGLEFQKQTRQRYAPIVSGWEAEPDMGRVVNGCAFRVDRIKSLGNGVVPAQARAAFEELMGLSNATAN